MTYRTTITLDDEAATFLREKGGDNKSAFITQLLRAERRRVLQEAVLAANREEAHDADYQQELHAWDTTLNDGLTDDLSPA